MFKRREVLVICSSGGHLTEALAAIERLDCDICIVTKKDPHVRNRLLKYDSKYINDPHTSLVGYLANAIRALFLVARERPKVIISTGAGISIATCLIAKFIGAKLIFIESGARVSTPSRTGMLLYKYADRFYVQWEPMLKYYPDAIYAGPLL